MVNTTKISATRQLLTKLVRDYSPLAMYNALRVEDMVLMDLICKHFPQVRLFTVDSGRLPAESHRLLHQIRRTYGDKLEVYYPNAYELQAMVKSQGTNGFFDSQANRVQCCTTRIMNPIKRALSGSNAWLRGNHSESVGCHGNVKLISFDGQSGIPLLAPLFQWSNNEIWSYIQQYAVPYHQLYDKKYTSIGCEPCTRAAGALSNNQSQQWWWENPVSQDDMPDLYIA